MWRNALYKSVRRRIIESYYNGKIERLLKNPSITSWDDIFAQKSIIVVLFPDSRSLDTFEYYYQLIHKNVEIKKILQYSNDYVCKEIHGHKVINLTKLPLEDKSDFFLVFDIDHYERIFSFFNDRGIRNICSSFQMEPGKITCYDKRMYKKSSGTSYMLNNYLKKGLYAHSNYTWRQCKKALEGKHCFLFGAGKGGALYVRTYNSIYPVEGIIDNDENMWGKELEGISIYGIGYLNRYTSDEVAIIVSAYKFDGIVNQLKDNGYKYIFPFFEMEANLFKSYRNKIEVFYSVHKPELLFKLYGLLPIDRKKIVFIRHNGQPFGCHEKYITLELLKRGIDCKLIWLLNDIYDKVPEGVTAIKNSQKNRIFNLATARIWLDDGLKPTHTIKRRGQVFISTHHGTGISLKKFGLDERKGDKGTPQSLAQFKRNDEISDIWLAASKTIADSYRTAFLYTGRIDITGSPRVDVLIAPPAGLREKVREDLGIGYNEKFILYAPTFIREKTKKSINKLNLLKLDQVCETLQNRNDCLYKAAVRLHSLDWGKDALDMYDFLGTSIQNLTSYPDVQELLLAADFLITDYSSIMFDMGYACKKVVLFVPELNDYLKLERDLYFDISELPFPICYTSDEVINAIDNTDDEAYMEKVAAFNKKCEILEDGKASERVVDLIETFLIK